MSLRCFFGQHEPGGIVARGQRLAVKCNRCGRISCGIAIDGIPPHVTQPIQQAPVVRGRISWLRGVFYGKVTPEAAQPPTSVREVPSVKKSRRRRS